MRRLSLRELLRPGRPIRLVLAHLERNFALNPSIECIRVGVRGAFS